MHTSPLLSSPLLSPLLRGCMCCTGHLYWHTLILYTHTYTCTHPWLCSGAFECQDSHDPLHGIVLQQMTPLRPITWGGDTIPHSLWAGGRDFVNVSYVHDIFLPSADSTAMLGVRCQGEDSINGILFAIDSNGNWNVSFSIAQLVSGQNPVVSGKETGFTPGIWHTVRIDVNGSTANIWMDGNALVPSLNVTDAPLSGHISTSSFRC
jgi:hypothetical protein